MTAQAPPVSEQRFNITTFRTRYLGPVVALILGVHVIVSCIWLVLSAPVQWELSFPEAAVVARAADVAQGESPYSDWRDYPHHFAPYGPATYAFVGWISTTFRDQDRLEFLKSVRLAGRIQSLIFIVGILTLVVAMLRRLGAHWGWSLLGLAAVLSWERLSDAPSWMSLFGYIASYRPDAPQAFFSLLALYIALGGSAANMRRLILAFAALYVSFWFKATPWGMLSALAFWVWRGRGVHQATLTLLIFALAGLIPVLILNWLWDGRLFLNLIGSLNNGTDPENLALIFSRMTPQAWLVFILGIFVAVLLWARAAMDSAEFLLSVASLTTLLATLILSLKVGADINYFLELHVLLAVCAILGICRLWTLQPMGGVPDEHPDSRVALRREIPLTILLLPFLLYTGGSKLFAAHEHVVGNIALWRQPPIVGRIQDYPGPVLSVYPWVGLTAPPPTSVLDYFQYRVLADRGLIDRNELLNRVREGRFGAIVIEGTPEDPGGEYYTRDFIEILRTYYRPAESYGGLFTLFVPDPAKVLQPPRELLNRSFPESPAGEFGEEAGSEVPLPSPEGAPTEGAVGGPGIDPR